MIFSEIVWESLRTWRRRCRPWAAARCVHWIKRPAYETGHTTDRRSVFLVAADSTSKIWWCGKVLSIRHQRLLSSWDSSVLVKWKKSGKEWRTSRWVIAILISSVFTGVAGEPVTFSNFSETLAYYAARRGLNAVRFQAGVRFTQVDRLVRNNYLCSFNLCVTEITDEKFMIRTLRCSETLAQCLLFLSYSFFPIYFLSVAVLPVFIGCFLWTGLSRGGIIICLWCTNC
jgi:hypothetical protein